MGAQDEAGSVVSADVRVQGEASHHLNIMDFCTELMGIFLSILHERKPGCQAFFLYYRVLIFYFIELGTHHAIGHQLLLWKDERTGIKFSMRTRHQGGHGLCAAGDDSKQVRRNLWDAERYARISSAILTSYLDVQHQCPIVH